MLFRVKLFFYFSKKLILSEYTNIYKNILTNSSIKIFISKTKIEGNFLYQVTTDVEKNRIYLQLKGFLQDDEVKKASDDVKKGINSLRPNFDIINDISEFNPATQEGKTIIKETQLYAVQKNVNRVVRITKNVIGKIQFERSSKEAGYSAITVESVEQAHKFLDSN